MIKLLRRYAEATWKPPFALTLPSDAGSYADRISVGRVVWRRALRQLNLAWHGQRHLERPHIDTRVHRRILWIHQGTPQVGDSLMDLAARELMRGRVQRLDLLTEIHLLPLYRHDDVFTKVASDPSELIAADYDLILLHSTSSRSVRDKLVFYREVPFVHIQGYFTGPEFNRTLFGFYRLAQLLKLPLGADALDSIAKPMMQASQDEEFAADALDLLGRPMAICLGGVRDWRTYHQWPEVIRILHSSAPTSSIILLGAENGLQMRDEILASGLNALIIDRVAKHTLPEVYAVMKRCSVVLAADGGLLHLAHAAGVSAVAIFAGPIQPSFRVTAANSTQALYGSLRVDDVSPEIVAACAVKALQNGRS